MQFFWRLRGREYCTMLRCSTQAEVHSAAACGSSAGASLSQGLRSGDSVDARELQAGQNTLTGRLSG